MVIKERYKKVKTLQNSAGFMLLEVIALVGFVTLVAIEITSLHGLIMNSYHETIVHMEALSYAENILASTLTGVPYTEPQETSTPSLFKSEVTKVKGVPFLPLQKSFSVVTVTVMWHKKELQEKIVLTRLITD